ncbi:MAG TPA: energy transducer TonB [Pyrinomonadaceae bacterium]|nr:energy transducer TonB [Pyrinomonadaceae bacterium]
MTAYEMNPVMAETKAPEPVKVFEPAEEVPVETIESKPFESAVMENKVEPEPPAFLSQNADEDILEFADEAEDEEITVPVVAATPVEDAQMTAPSIISAPVEEEQETRPASFSTPVAPVPVVPAPVVSAPTVQSVAPSNVEDYQRTYQSKKTESSNFASQATGGNGYESKASNKKLGDDGFYSVTLVQSQNDGTRNMLLLGAAVLVLSISFGALIFSLFNSDAYIGALDDNLNSIVFVGDDVPAEDPEVPKPKDKDKGGGGGGGGNEEETPTSKGVLASQSEKPQIPPSAHMDKVTNPELVLKPETQGNRKEQPTNEKYGDPNSKYDVDSDGTGSGGGQGSGNGRGQGSGRGTGAGSGDGSGNGSGVGNGNGNGRGNGIGDDKDEPPQIKVGPSTPLNILSKPKPPYTDAARQNQVQGTVTLRVTFNANGTIGGISPVSGLPYGLTESAIAAARNIRFEPMKKNGVAQTVTKTLQFTFTMY